MIKLKDLLLEGKPPSIFVPRRMEDRIERLIKTYIRNGNKGDLNLHGLHLTVLPDILKDITVGGHFDCSVNKLTSLEGAPKTVGGNFLCSNNNLITLEGAPWKVGLGYSVFRCRFNKIRSLIGSPEIVYGEFDISNNPELESLEGIPKKVTGDFMCHACKGKFNRKQIEAVCDVGGSIYY